VKVPDFSTSTINKNCNQDYLNFIINFEKANLVEEIWNTEHKILNKRKNMNPKYLAIYGEENSGVELNRNYGTD
jgi:hypothetical protein